MDTQVIKVKCPFCGTPLGIKITAGIEYKTITCPACKQSSPYNAFKQMGNNKQEEDPTEYPNRYNAKCGERERMHTKKEEHQTDILGQLKVVNSSTPAYSLKIGKNIIGRKTSNSTADFQIFTGESKRLSREHLSIEVKKVAGKGLVHYVSLCKMKSNETFVNSDRIEYGDCIILQHGDILRLPDVSIKFEIPDDDGTSL